MYVWFSAQPPSSVNKVLNKVKFQGCRQTSSNIGIQIKNKKESKWQNCFSLQKQASNSPQKQV